VKYVQAVKPEKHNGGVFFEHEIHFELVGKAARGSSRLVVEAITEFISENIGSKHSDFRVSAKVCWIHPDGNIGMSPVPHAIIKARFADKNKALLFKLSYII
jgi:hypothetical protein